MRIQPLDYPPVQLVEAFPDLAATEVVSPSSDDRVDRCDQITQPQRYAPLCQVPDLIFESVYRLLCGNGIEIPPVQLGFDPIEGQLTLRFPALDFESKKLEAVRNVHDPGFVPVKRHTELLENLCCTSQDVVRLCSCPTGHDPIVCSSRELVSLSSHLLLKGSQQDIAQQWRHDALKAGYEDKGRHFDPS